MSYLRSVHLHKDKTIFKVAELPVEEFAASLGLPGVPRIKFLSKGKAEKKNSSSGGVALQGGTDKEHGTLSQSEQSGDPKVCIQEAR